MTSVGHETCEASIPNVIRVDEEQVRCHVDQVVRATVEETLNGLLEAEADELCGAKRYERSPERLDTRAGHYDRQLHTKAGEVELRVPQAAEPAVRDADHRALPAPREQRGGGLVEMYLAGVSVRRVEDITEALWGTRVSPSTVSELNQKIYAQIEVWRNRPIEGRARLRVPGRHLAEAELGRRGEERGRAGGDRRA